jgi:hypothetical protein
MLDTLGTLIFGSTTATLLVAILSSIKVSFGSRLSIAAIVGAWIGVVIAAAAPGKLPPLAFLGLFSFPLVVAAVLASLPAARAVLAELPVRLIVGLNAFRVAGFLFLLLLLAGRLGGPFPYFAGIGDILTGLFALPAARLAARTAPDNPRVLAWNAFGMLDLIVAVALGITSINGSPLQLIRAGVGTAAITTLPWALVPLVLVPTFLIGHCIVFAHARAHAASRTFAQQRLAGV